MVLTQCAACAAPLGLSLGKKCGRCSTRYCGRTCQEYHWKEGGHDKLCKQIKRSGGAEQYNANNKYTEAVAAAVEKCEDDTKGQTCYICLEAVHPRTGEGLVRGCACGDRDGVASGSTGVAHVSCLAEQAKILVAEAEENKLDIKVWNERWDRWHTCSLCEQEYHGVVYCALGWACWKTYLGRPEADQTRLLAISQLGHGLSSSEHHEDALSVKEAELSMRRRLGDSEQIILAVQANLAGSYSLSGRDAQALDLLRDIYPGFLKHYGEENDQTLGLALNYASALGVLGRFEEAKSLLRKSIPVARRVLGEEFNTTVLMGRLYAEALCKDGRASRDDKVEAVAMLEELSPIARRVFGPLHPTTTGIQCSLTTARRKLLLCLRFAIGARVECLISDDTWVPGRVIKLHYHESGFEPGYFAPYQIELDDGGLIYAPDDDDECIRAAS